MNFVYISRASNATYLCDFCPHDGLVVDDVFEGGVYVEWSRQSVCIRSQILHRFRVSFHEGRREADGHERVAFFQFS